MKKNKVLVTGAAGFIGSHMCESLLKKNFIIVCDGSQKRDFVYVTDVVNAFYQAMITKKVEKFRD